MWPTSALSGDQPAIPSFQQLFSGDHAAIPSIESSLSEENEGPVLPPVSLLSTENVTQGEVAPAPNFTEAERQQQKIDRERQFADEGIAECWSSSSSDRGHVPRPDLALHGKDFDDDVPAALRGGFGIGQLPVPLPAAKPGGRKNKVKDPTDYSLKFFF